MTGILEKIVNEKKEWIHVKDDIGRNALHYAASTGYLYGVEYLLQHCHTCNMEKDNDGFFPLHLASAFGHTKVLKKLLENCPNPREIVDNKGRNIVHISTIMGQFNVVKYILQDTNDEVKDMINDKDCDGNTPLHLAASHSRPKIVQALTWDTKVDLHCLNNNNQTALDVFEQFRQENNPPFPQASIYRILCLLKNSRFKYVFLVYSECYENICSIGFLINQNSSRMIMLREGFLFYFSLALSFSFFLNLW